MNTPTDQTIINGDCMDAMADMDENSVHAVVTDPPYNFDGGFMGEEWDDIGTLEEYREWCVAWASEALRVLKPGGHLIAFSGSRTHSHLFCGVHDAGFKIRDTLTWHYSSGMPKGGDIGKHIDRWGTEYRESEVRKVCEWLREEVKSSDKSFQDVADHMGVSKSLAHAHWCAAPRHVNAELPSKEQLDDILAFIDAAIDDSPKQIQAFYDKHLREETGSYADSWDDRKVIGKHPTPAAEIYGTEQGNDVDLTAPATPEAEQWMGWEQNLKPATEFAVLARKPLSESATYKNVLEHGTGALNISATEIKGENRNRHPANLVVSEGATSIPTRYFYTSKASNRERTVNGQVGNDHNTVKPLDLMEYLVALVTARGQRVLDPFAGSGTTIMACRRLNREGIGIEQDSDYADLARHRVDLAHELETEWNNSSPEETTDRPEESNELNEEGQQGLEAFTDGGRSGNSK